MYGKSEDIEKVEPKSVYNGVTENYSFEASRVESQNEMQYQNSQTCDLVKNPRHCSVCLKLCSPVKLCGKCLKRAYCSRECQLVDWSPKGKGQGHKNWCRLECGEEDVDWEVTSIPGKGLGVVAKRMIPPLYRIIVEGVFTDPQEHPGIMDLMPGGGTAEEKFSLNAISGRRHPEKKNFVALRIARVNHCCSHNADHTYDDGTAVHILFSNREIQKGEEICIDYGVGCDVNVGSSNEETNYNQDELLINKDNLKLRWGVVCPSDCVCNESQMTLLVNNGKQLCKDCNHLFTIGKRAAAFKTIKEVINIQEKIYAPAFSKAKSHFAAFEIAIMTEKTLPEANQHLRYVCNLYAAVFPFSTMTVEKLKLLENPKLHPNYLVHEYQSYQYGSRSNPK